MSVVVGRGPGALTLLAGAVAALAGSGCFGDDPRDPNVVEAGEGVWAGGGWQLEEVWRRGGSRATEPYIFSAWPLAVARGPGTQLVVADPRGRSVRVYDARDGAFLRGLSREGEGPGEWRAVVAIATTAENEIWLVDFRNRRYLVCDSAAAGCETHATRPVTRLPRLTRPGVFDSSGALLEEGEIDLPDGREALAVVRVSGDGTIIDSLPPVAEPRRPPVTGRGGPVPAGRPSRISLADYLPRLVYDVTEGSIWFAESSEMRIVQRSHGGDTLMVIEAGHRDGMELTSEERRQLESLVGGIEGSGFSRQIVQSIHVLDDGHVLVQIEEESGISGSKLDVFEPDGLFLGTLAVGHAIDDETPIESVGDTLFVVGKDSMGAKFLSRLHIRRTR